MIPRETNECYVRIAIDPVTKAILNCGLRTSRSILTALGFLRGIQKTYGPLPKELLTDGGVWCPFACQRLGAEHERIRGGVRSLAGRFTETFKDSAGRFATSFPCPKDRCRFEHALAWVLLLIVDNNWVRPDQSRSSRPRTGWFGGSAWNRYKGAVRLA